MFTQAYLKSILRYEPRTGRWYWRVSKGGQKAGNRAGCVDIYWKIRINKRNYPASRLAWLYMLGEWPSQLIDHKDCNKLNDRWSNYRLASNAQNVFNFKHKGRNGSGLRGVDWAPRHKKWRARIRVNDRLIFLGCFATKRAAAIAYRSAAKQHFREFAR